MNTIDCNFLKNYYDVTLTGLIKARKKDAKEILLPIAIEETADFFKISKKEVIQELNR